MLDRFYGNKKYVFRKSLFIKSMGECFLTPWVEELDNAEVEVTSRTAGKCVIKNRTYYVSPNWCELVEV